MMAERVEKRIQWCRVYFCFHKHSSFLSLLWNKPPPLSSAQQSWALASACPAFSTSVQFPPLLPPFVVRLQMSHMWSVRWWRERRSQKTWSWFPELPWFWSETRFGLSPWHTPLLQGWKDDTVTETLLTGSRGVRGGRKGQGTGWQQRPQLAQTRAEPDEVPADEDGHVEHAVRRRVQQDVVRAQRLLQADLPLPSAGKNNSCITQTAQRQQPGEQVSAGHTQKKVTSKTSCTELAAEVPQKSAELCH